MPRKRTKSRNTIEQDFIDAIARIKDGRPQDPELREKLARGKSVKITFATVAKEANRARGLISKLNCRYPEIRQQILLEMGEVATTRDDVIVSLRTQVAELRVQLREAQAQAAYHFSMRAKAEKNAVYKERYDRLKARIAKEDREKRTSPTKIVSLFPERSRDPD